MDSFDFDNVKAEKEKALNRLYSFRSIGFLFRVAEICVALLFVCWIFTCLPFAVRISGEFLCRLAFVVSTPLFMFVLGNSIVLALLTTKSTVFSAGRTIGGDGGPEVDIYDAFIRSGEYRASFSEGVVTEEIVYDDKNMIVTETDSNSNSKPTVAREDHVRSESEMDTNFVTDSAKDHPAPLYRRSKSEISTKHLPEMISKPYLRRAKTEKCRKIVESCDGIPLDGNYPEDNLSNEEFQKTIEAFIAKQLIFRRRESLAVVIHNQI